MKIAYFDCFSGASGDMILGSLLDAGLDLEELKNEINKLNLTGYKIQITKGNKKGIAGTKLTVIVSYDHPHRNLKDIIKIIEKSRLNESIRNKSKDIFSRLAEAEAKIHDRPVDEIHFHEVGAVDSIVDIVGTVIGLELLNIQDVRSSRLHVGTGFLECSHGTLPVPPPATLELLREVPIYSTGIEGELVTPTGAAILSTLVKQFGSIPPMRIEKTGYGLGSKDLSIPNALRVLIGETEEEVEEDTVQLIETNIDDMNPQFYDHVMETLFTMGAKDVFLNPVIMKKNRPGIVLSVLVSPDRTEEFVKILFRETTTLGVRISDIKKRKVLKREIKTISTRWGKVRIKIGTLNADRMTISPEYEDCKRFAQKYHFPIQEVYKEIKREAEKQFGSDTKK